MPTVVDALFEDLRASLLKTDQAAGILPLAKGAVAAARAAGAGRPSWLRYCDVTFSPGRISQQADRMAARLAAR